MIRNARDTFLHFVADNLTGITVHAVRVDTNDPGASLMQLGAVNIEFLNMAMGQIATVQAAIDILFEDENTAVDCMQQLWDLLSAAFMTPIFDYTIPSLPVQLPLNIEWDKKSVRFRKVVSTTYVHYTCVLPLRFTDINN